MITRSNLEIICTCGHSLSEHNDCQDIPPFVCTECSCKVHTGITITPPMVPISDYWKLQ